VFPFSLERQLLPHEPGYSKPKNRSLTSEFDCGMAGGHALRVPHWNKFPKPGPPYRQAIEACFELKNDEFNDAAIGISGCL